MSVCWLVMVSQQALEVQNYWQGVAQSHGYHLLGGAGACQPLAEGLVASGPGRWDHTASLFPELLLSGCFWVSQEPVAKPSARQRGGWGGHPAFTGTLELGCEPSGLTSLTTCPRTKREVRRGKLGPKQAKDHVSRAYTVPFWHLNPCFISEDLRGTAPPSRVTNGSPDWREPPFPFPEWASLPVFRQLGLIKG